MVAHLVLALVGLLCLQPPAPGPEPITVSAAASLTDALDEIARAYAASGGGPVRFNFAGSNVLARQIANGAPSDLFISADAAQMDVAQRAGGIDPSTRIDLLRNHLAVVTREPLGIADVRGLTSAQVRRIAVGDPHAVPAGVYARQYLESSGIWTAVSEKIVPVSNVRAALSAVENGSVDAAIVYESDAAASTRVALAFVVTGQGAPRIVYPAALVRGSTRRADAIRFLTWLRSPQATAIFRRFKFTPLAAAS